MAQFFFVEATPYAADLLIKQLNLAKKIKMLSQKINDSQWEVSTSEEKTYTVETSGEGTLACTCTHFITTLLPCRHALKVVLVEDLIPVATWIPSRFRKCHDFASQASSSRSIGV